TMSEITRRRPDEFRNFVAVLKFRAIDFDEGPRASKQNLSGGFNNPCFARTSRSKEKQVAYWTAGHVHTCKIDLVHVHDSLDSAGLAHDLAQKPACEIEHFRTSHLRIKLYFF